MIYNETIQHIELPSKAESLSRIESLIEELCQKCCINEDSYGNMLVALTEAVNNAITHGNKYNPKKKVNLDFKTNGKEISFIVKDEGNGFDYNHVPDPTLPENINKLNGRGVFLMKTLADEIKFEENGSSVRLKFSISVN